MTAKILYGKGLAERIRAGIKKKVSRLRPRPGLAVVQVGKNPASDVYISLKEKKSLECGIKTEIFKLDERTSQDELLGLINKLNKNKRVHGFIVQKPLPAHINEALVDRAILPEKDVDGFNPINVAAVFMNQKGFVPATPKGIMRLLEASKIKLEGRNAVVIGRSLIVGRPLAMLLMHNNATVTICHSRTKDIAEITKRADIVCIAIGRPKFLKPGMVKKGAVVVDIGINRLDNGSIVGDANFDEVKNKASCITPVPGGVGPMTIAMLLENTLDAYMLQKK